MPKVIEGIKTKLTGGSSKRTTTLIIAGLAIIGVLGSFEFMKFNMSDYVLFLDKFLYFIGAITVSIGANGIVDKIKNGGKLPPIEAPKYEVKK